MDDFVDFIKSKGYSHVMAAFAEYYEKGILGGFTIQVDPSFRNYEIRLMRNKTKYFTSVYEYCEGYQYFVETENDYIETAKNIIKINMEQDIKKDFV